MFTLIGDYDVQETRRAAKTEGRKEMAYEIARSALENSMAILEVASLTGLSIAEIENIDGIE